MEEVGGVRGPRLQEGQGQSPEVPSQTFPRWRTEFRWMSEQLLLKLELLSLITATDP